MNEKEILQEIIEWLGNDTSYLSTRTDYARGYKSGIECAKEIVESIINKHNPDLLPNNQQIVSYVLNCYSKLSS